jgi:hypothetical protein
MIMHIDVPYTTVLDALPLPAVFLLIVALVLLSIEGGFRLGLYRRRRHEQEKEAPVGAMVGSTLGLLAFVLAFTFGMAASRFDARKSLVLEEANAIGTTYLRAAMLPESEDEVRGLLRQYVDGRLAAVQSGDAMKVVNALQQSEALQSQMWTLATAAGKAHPNSIVVGLFVESLNDVIDLHSKRVSAGLRNRIPGPIWASLFVMTALSLGAMGYHSGLAGPTRSLAIFAVAIAFSAMIGLIVDLDRPQEGALTVSQQALVDLRQSMTAP